MKFAWVMLLALLGPAAFADYYCKDSNSNELIVSYDPVKGTRVDLTSPEIAAHYLADGLTIKTLESVLDPEDGRYVSDRDGNVDTFMVFAPNSGTDTVWGLRLDMSVNSAGVEVVDMAGTTFKFSMSCEDSRN